MIEVLLLIKVTNGEINKGKGTKIINKCNNVDSRIIVVTNTILTLICR
jgi:hypothetical protein